MLQEETAAQFAVMLASMRFSVNRPGRSPAPAHGPWLKWGPRRVTRAAVAGSPPSFTHQRDPFPEARAVLGAQQPASRAPPTPCRPPLKRPCNARK
jgi:hypothetical protein